MVRLNLSKNNKQLAVALECAKQDIKRFKALILEKDAVILARDADTVEYKAKIEELKNLLDLERIEKEKEKVCLFKCANFKLL